MDRPPQRKVIRWPYTKHLKGKISVTIDNNVWNFLAENKIDLASELPADQFALFIPREGEIEGQAIPDREEKQPIRTFIKDTILRANVRTSSTFGFFGPEPQRRGGWGQGPFQSSIGREIYAELYRFFGDKTMGSGLIANEGDAAVAVLSFFSVVLTNERPTKNGPLRFAYENGGKVLFLRLFPEAARNLRQHVLACYDEDPGLASHSQH